MKCFTALQVCAACLLWGGGLGEQVLGDSHRGGLHLGPCAVLVGRGGAAGQGVVVAGQLQRRRSSEALHRVSRARHRLECSNHGRLGGIR